jgi:hypothetical protein
MITIEQRIMRQVLSLNRIKRHESEPSQIVSRKSGQGPLFGVNQSKVKASSSIEFQIERLKHTGRADNTSPNEVRQFSDRWKTNWLFPPFEENLDSLGEHEFT